jgi:hypothetical protein
MIRLMFPHLGQGHMVTVNIVEQEGANMTLSYRIKLNNVSMHDFPALSKEVNLF